VDPERWERVQEIFHRAAELADPIDRRRFLEQSCGDDHALRAEVERMLDEDARASLLDLDVTQIAGKVFAGELSTSFRESSPYRIQRVLGEGGMGVVYLAERSDLGNLVAIKILRDGWLSPDRRRRFAAEQRTLAQLNHPSIARLYDASTLPDGTPWFVMEYVDGVPLTEYCRQNNCSLEQRVRLIRAVGEAVQYAHEHGVVHRDLKPSNILVKQDGSLRLVDFGIAKQLDRDGAATQTQLRPLTPAYASPEQLRGEPVGISSDVYSLGVVLYELLAGKLPFDLANKAAAEAEALITTAEPAKPSLVARRAGLKAVESGLDAVCLTAMDKNPAQRYPSAAALVRDLDHYLSHEPLETRRDSFEWSIRSFARRNARAVMVSAAMLLLIGAAVALTLAFMRKPASSRPRTVAVIPFENLGTDHDLDFLEQALPEEVWRNLDRARSLTLRSIKAGAKYTGAARDLKKAGRELGVNTIASGRFFKVGDQLQIALDLTDVESGRVIWGDLVDTPAGDMVVMQAKVAGLTRRGMAPELGVTEFASRVPTPTNEEAYKLYLQARAIPETTDPPVVEREIAMLTRSVTLDPSYGPAWHALAGWHNERVWWGTGGEEELREVQEFTAKAAALDPDDLDFVAGRWYGRSYDDLTHKDDAITKSETYRQLEEMLRRRPDSARLHFYLSWVLRDVGLLDEAARECDVSMLIDVLDSRPRSCGVTFMLRGEYPRALEFLRTEPYADVSKAVTIDVLLRQQKYQEALDAMSASLPQWGGYPMLQAYLQHRPASRIAEMARELKPTGDPEVNYFSAAHLAYVGQTEAALPMLKRAVDGGYCSFPAAKSDPMFSSLRNTPQFAAIETAGMACQDRFQKQRAAIR
jgi:serine/threonine protein kinase